MNVITRHLAKEILASTGFVLLALVGLFAFFDLVNQLGDISKGELSVIDAIIITALSLPIRIYEVMPIAALLGTVFVMSQWAARSEFTILRVAGLSPVRMATILMVPGIVLMTLTYGFGEFIAPSSDQYMREYRAFVKNRTLSVRGSNTGAWVREVIKKGDVREVRYINIQKMTPEQEAFGWRVYDFSVDQHLSRVIEAKSGTWSNGQGWLLRQATETALPQLNDLTQAPILDEVMVSLPVSMMLTSKVDPGIFSVMMLKPENMSMRALYHYVTHLQQSQQDSGRYEISLWNKAFYPIAILVMIALAMPFAYMNTRSGGMSIKIFGGVMLGLAFYTVNNLFSYIGMLNTWPPLVVALVPTTIMLMLAMFGMWVVEKR